jgi:hypothetical protein
VIDPLGPALGSGERRESRGLIARSSSGIERMINSSFVDSSIRPPAVDAATSR